MADSVKVVDNEYIARLHPKRQSGHFHKGSSTVAANASIPTKYQTIVTDNSDEKGFLSQAKRFSDDSSMTESPSPGTYYPTDNLNTTSPSISRKGTGSFASKSRRKLQYISTSGPGPGIYALPSLLSTRKDFNRSHVERMFQLPIANAREKTNGIPAPNAYEVSNFSGGKTNNVAANAAFMSKSRRDFFDLSEQKKNPAPGQYKVNDSLLHDSVKVPFSSFKSTTKRQMMPDSDNIPGPGAYNPHTPVDYPAKMLFPRKHYLCLSAPAIPLPVTPPSPGPGAYEVGGFKGSPKHYMSSAVFVSTTGRWTVPHGDTSLPGPYLKGSSCAEMSDVWVQAVNDDDGDR